jgi:hypothetical protein
MDAGVTQHVWLVPRVMSSLIIIPDGNLAARNDYSDAIKSDGQRRNWVRVSRRPCNSSLGLKGQDSRASEGAAFGGVERRPGSRIPICHRAFPVLAFQAMVTMLPLCPPLLIVPLESTLPDL